MKKLLAPLLLLTSMMSHGEEPSDTRISTRIVGGTPATESYSWMVSIQFASGDHFCGGTLISPYWVLTAQHCLEDVRPEHLRLVIGANDLTNESSAEVRQADWIVSHADYREDYFLNGAFTIDNDIALIRLTEPSNKTALPLMNAATFDRLYEGFSVRVIGWGDLEEGANLGTDILQEVDITFRKDASCAAIYGSDDSYWSRFFCAGEVNGGKDSCQGDSGGPIFANVDGTQTLLGVVSWGDGCAREGNYGVYTQVSNYFDWIDQQVNGLHISGSELIGFIGEDRKRPETYNLINSSSEDISLASKRIAIGSAVFEIDDANWGLESIAAGTSCSFKVNAVGASVGEFNGRMEITTATPNAPVVEKSLNTKVLSTLSADESALLDNQWTWYTGHDADWEQTTTELDGNIANGREAVLAAGSISSAGDRSVLMTYLSGPGVLRFDALVRGQTNTSQLAALTYESDDMEIIGSSLNSDWQTYEITLSSNEPHQVLFIYSKLEARNLSHYALLDNVRFCPSSESQESECSTASTDFFSGDLSLLDDPVNPPGPEDVCKDVGISSENYSVFSSTSVKAPKSSGGGGLGWISLMLSMMLFRIRHKK